MVTESNMIDVSGLPLDELYDFELLFESVVQYISTFPEEGSQDLSAADINHLLIACKTN